MSFEIFEQLCKDRGLKTADVAHMTGIPAGTFSNWKNGRYAPKADKRRKIAECLGVSLEVLDGVADEAPADGYYFNQETAETAERIFKDRNLRALFDAACDSRPENIQMAAELLRRLKATNPDG